VRLAEGEIAMVSKLALDTYNNPKRKVRFESFAEDRGHYVFVETNAIYDRALCSCGWTGELNEKGVARAWGEWRAHVIEESVKMTLPLKVVNSEKP
jgi:hypothetical protein